jgi:hypothetical protein
MARKTIVGTQSRGASALKPDVSASGASLNNKRLKQPKPAIPKQAILGGAGSLTDTGSDALIETYVPVKVPEVAKQKQVALTAKAQAAKPKIKTKKLASVKSKSAQSKTPKSRALGKLATKTVPKIPTKQTVPSKLSVASSAVKDAQSAIPSAHIIKFDTPHLVNFGNAQNENNLSSPPWSVAEQSSDNELLPLPRHAALQIYEKTHWLSGLGFWMRSNIRPLFARRQKVVSVTRPIPQKLSPRDMVTELNRLAEENRALRRKLAKMNGDKE